MSWDNVAVQVLHANVSTYSIPKLLNMSLVGLGQIQSKDLSSKEDGIEISDNVLASKNEIHHKMSLNPGAQEFVPGSAVGNPKEIEVTSENAETKKEGLKPPKLLSQKGKAVISKSIRYSLGACNFSARIFCAHIT